MEKRHKVKLIEKLTEKFIDRYSLLIIVVITFWAWRSLLVFGYYGASDDMHIAWLYEMDKIIRIGQFPPRFVPDLSFGFGYPLFNFVFPLPFYLAEIFHLLGLSLVDSIKTVFLLSLPLSGYFMYKLVKQFSSAWLALAAAVVYVYTPYRATDIYVRGAVGEALAFVFLPLIILTVVKLFKEDKLNRKWIGIGSLSLAGLILSHNITAYLFIPLTIFLIVVALIFNNKRPLFLLQSGLFVILGFIISSYFWLPAIWESRLMQYSTIFGFSDHFPTIRQLLTPYFGYGASVPGPGDGLSFFIGLINLLLATGGFITALIYWKKFTGIGKSIIAWSFLVLTISVFMMNYRSTIIWQTIPFLPYFQFPWRFLTVTTLITSILTLALSALKPQKYLAILIIVVAIGVNAGYFRPQDFLGRTDSYYLNRYIPTTSVSQEYQSQSEEYLRLPRETSVKPERLFPIAYSPGSEIKDIEKINDLSFKVTSNSDQDFRLNISKYNLPGWQVWVDNQKTEIFTSKPYGNISVNVPAGRHQIEVKYRETQFRGILNLVSVIGLLSALILICPVCKRFFRNNISN